MSNENCKRKYERFDIDLAVRFLSKSNDEATGRVVDISAGGFAMITDADAEIGDELIAYPEGLGRLTGIVRRRTKDGLAVEFDLSTAQRAHLMKRIDSALTGVPYIRLLENRTHNRIQLNFASMARDLDTGNEFACEIIDLSASGARIKADTKPITGSLIQIGALRGVVCRLTEDGFGVQFEANAEISPDDTRQEDKQIQPSL